MRRSAFKLLRAFRKAFLLRLSHAVDVKIAIGTYVVWVHEGCVAWVRENVPETTLFKFMTSVEAKYPSENPFHNFSHGLDVLYNVSRFCRLVKLLRA